MIFWLTYILCLTSLLINRLLCPVTALLIRSLLHLLLILRVVLSLVSRLSLLSRVFILLFMLGSIFNASLLTLIFILDRYCGFTLLSVLRLRPLCISWSLFFLYRRFLPPSVNDLPRRGGSGVFGSVNWRLPGILFSLSLESVSQDRGDSPIILISNLPSSGCRGLTINVGLFLELLKFV